MDRPTAIELNTTFDMQAGSSMAVACTWLRPHTDVRFGDSIASCLAYSTTHIVRLHGVDIGHYWHHLSGRAETGMERYAAVVAAGSTRSMRINHRLPRFRQADFKPSRRLL